MGLELAHSLLQLLERPQIAGVEGHILPGYGPEEGLLLPLVVQSGLIGGSAGHEEQSQGPGPQLAVKGFELLLRSRQAADGKAGIQPQEFALRRAQQLPGEVQDLRGGGGDCQEAGSARGYR